MSWQDCIAEIRAAGGRTGAALSDAEIEHILETIMRKAQRKAPLGMLDSDGLRIAAQALVEEGRKAAALKKLNALKDMLKRIGRRQRIEGAPDPVDGFRAEIHGINTPIFGARNSAQAEWEARLSVYLDGLSRDLDRAGMFKSVRAGALEREWTRELFELSKGDSGRPGLTGSAEALRIAQIVHRYQTMAKTALNRAGGAIGDYAGYITRTSHDMDKIRRAGAGRFELAPPAAIARENWKRAIKPLLAPETFDYVGGPAGKGAEDFLDNVWSALTTGVHLTHEGMQGFKDLAFTGPGNLAKRFSQDRILHFKDADSWLEYHKQFGRGSVIDNVLKNLARSARATALMNHFGTNPRAEFEADLRYFKEKLRNSDPDAVRRLAGWERPLTNRFDLLEGKANMPVNRLWAKIGQAARLDQVMSKLGLVLFTHMSVGATKAAELRYQGANLLEQHINAVTSIFRGRNEIADELLAGFDGMRRDLISQFEPDDGPPARSRNSPICSSNGTCSARWSIASARAARN